MIDLRTLAVPGLFVLLALPACRNVVVPAELPPSVRSDYEVFAQRCSKCHTLARPLNAGIEDDAHWELYFERMRVMPGSGITEEDKAPILRFLHYYTEERRARSAKTPAADAQAPAPSAPDAQVPARSTPDVATDGGAP